MDSCLLCLEFNKNAIKIDSKKSQDLNIKHILEKHFWPLESIENFSLICLTCWQVVDDFHKFYKRIEEIHTNFERIKVEEVAVEYKVEENNYEYCFQEPEIFIQQTEPPGMLEEREFSLKEPLKDPDMYASLKRKSKRLRKDNNIDNEDPLEKCKSPIIDELLSVEDSKKKRSKKNEYPDKKIEEEFRFGKEATASDQCSKRDDCYDSNYDNICFVNDPAETDPVEKTAERKKRESYDNHRKKSEENDKFIAEHYKKMTCDICQAPFKNFPSLQKHFTENHKQRGYVVCCKRKFRDRTRLIDHLLCHLNPDYYQCKECGKSMSERISFKNHMLRVHRAHEVVKKHSCSICGKSFIKAYVLRDHMLTHLPEEEKKFPCKECGKNYASAYILSQHQQAVHLKRFAKICDICGKSFNSNVELNAHINKHEGIPPPVLACDVCGLRLTTAKGLKLHKANQHPVGGKQEHPCPKCAKVSPNIIALRKHIKTMHGKGYIHKCAICEKAFKRSETLKEHMAAHTGNALYKCQWCPMTFNSNGNMYAHRKKMHPKEWEQTKLQKYATNITQDISKTV